MRTVKLTGLEQLTKTSGRSSFPDVIYFEQETNLKNNTTEGRYSIPRGTIGESYHTFGIELGSNLENEFKSAINSTEREADMRAIRLSTILNSYTCFEVDDPGVQATSECFSDIFVQIYKPDGLKVSQNNIGFIRNFTTKRVLIFFKNRTTSSNIENEIPKYSIFITPLMRYNSGNELRDPSDYIISDKDGNDISENILYFGSFNNGNSLIKDKEIILSSRSTNYDSSTQYITPYSYNTFSMKNIITKDLSNNEPFTNSSSFGGISYDSFLSNINGISCIKKYTRLYESNNKGFGASVDFAKLSNREEYEAEYYKNGKYIWKSSEDFSIKTDVDEIDYNLSAGHRIEIDVKFDINYNFTDNADKDFTDAIYRLIHSILYKAHIYRWNIDISKCTYKVFLNGLYKASSFSITANDILTLIIYDNGESIDSNANKDDNFINNINIIISSENNSIFEKSLSDNLIKTNPYLNVFGNVSEYNSEYFVHDLDDSGYVPYDYEIVASKNTGTSANEKIKDIIFPYNLSYTIVNDDR